jgi:hypothetical protein
MTALGVAIVFQRALISTIESEMERYKAEGDLQGYVVCMRYRAEAKATLGYFLRLESTAWEV